MVRFKTTHPGKVLLGEFLVPLEMTVHQLARQTLLPHAYLNGIINGDQNISPDTALRFAKFFGTSARFWLDLQDAYDKSIEETRRSEDFLRNLAVTKLMSLPKSRYRS